MLNNSHHSISKYIDRRKYSSLRTVEERSTSTLLIRTLFTIMIISLGIMLLPWTQNINSRGSITTLSPDQRPQNVHSVIAGQIERWYVREGDYVQKIVNLSNNHGDYIKLRKFVFANALKSPLFDNQNYSKSFFEALEKIVK